MLQNKELEVFRESLFLLKRDQKGQLQNSNFLSFTHFSFSFLFLNEIGCFHPLPANENVHFISPAVHHVIVSKGLCFMSFFRQKNNDHTCDDNNMGQS